MKLVKTDEARPGQRAARDVTDLRGNLLFKAGTELTGDLLVVCRQRNISHLFIEDTAGGPAEASATDLEMRREAVARDLDKIFAGVDTTPPMVALREAAKRYLTAKLNAR